MLKSIKGVDDGNGEKQQPQMTKKVLRVISVAGDLGEEIKIQSIPGGSLLIINIPRDSVLPTVLAVCDARPDHPGPHHHQRQWEAAAATRRELLLFYLPAAYHA